MNHKNNNQGFSVKELLSKEEVLSVWQYKCTLERKENRRNRRKEREKHNGRW